MKAARVRQFGLVLRALADELERNPPQGYKYRRLEDPYSATTEIIVIVGTKHDHQEA